jgi:hypothetical protein
MGEGGSEYFVYEIYYNLGVSSSSIKSMVVSNDAPMLAITAKTST